jgi:hypothetical protein
MREQARHLAKYVIGRRKVKDMRLCSVEVAHRAFDERPIAEYTEPLLWLQFRALGRLPGCFDVVGNGLFKTFGVLSWMISEPRVA